MAISETSFADRYGRGQQLHAAVSSFVPPFAPAFSALEPANFLAFLANLDTLNTDVATLTGTYSTEVAARTELIKDAKNRAQRALRYVESNPAWANYVPSVKRPVDKIRGNRPSRPRPPAAGEQPGSPQARQRNQGEQSYAEIAENLQQLIAAVQSVSGYAPPAAVISIAELQTLSSNLSAKNSSMAALAVQVGNKQKERLEAFDGPGGLKELMKATKKAVAAQYGTDSSEYAQVKSIRV